MNFSIILFSEFMDDLAYLPQSHEVSFRLKNILIDSKTSFALLFEKAKGLVSFIDIEFFVR